ncbi:hypothetical protein [Nostoc sp. FACHB-280]|uniref:hypothetical protein n=1 Tax=Nostoc sp. FACHB-280 TaxID=2692839 RepID=UPI00168A65FB|nr:hypothetical protein [Nostoc sp. FACHB-280]MBD2493749.1 hypothetical protein [Nostoc sp. FACHB-280]
MPNIARDIAMQRLFIFLYILSHSLRESRMLAIPGEIASNILRNAAYLTQNLNLFVIVIPKELLSTNKIDQTLNQRRNACWVRDMKLITKIKSSLIQSIYWGGNNYGYSISSNFVFIF